MKAALHTVLRDLGRRLAVPVEPESLLRRDGALGLQPPGRSSPNGHCRLVRALDGWMAVNLARPDDWETVSAWLEVGAGGDPWRVVEQVLPVRHKAALLERAVLLHLPVACVAEVVASWPELRQPGQGWGRLRRVVDLSALWAGPLAGGLLAAAGAEVVKVEGPNRPDPTPIRTPDLDRRLNGAKRRLVMGLDDPALIGLIAGADVLVTSARPQALARAGLTPDILFALNPGLLWVAVTAHGWAGEGAARVGFGDDCAAAGGLLAWEDGVPRFLGDALADPCTGLIAALATFEAVRDGKAGLLDVSLAGSAAWVAARMRGCA